MIERKRTLYLLLILLPALFIISACLLDVFVDDTPVEFASKLLGVNIPENAVILVDEYSEHAFPLGDGYSFTVFQIPADAIDAFGNQLAGTAYWYPLPLPDDLAEQSGFLQPTFVFGRQEIIPIAEAQGFYYFYDEQVEYNRTHNSNTYEVATPFSERGSFNFTFALFDVRDGKLYFWDLDT